MQLEIEAFGSNEFILILKSPDGIVAGQEETVVFEVSLRDPDGEIPYNTDQDCLDSGGTTEQCSYTQKANFKFTTDCTGFSCIVSAATNFESPQTIALYVGIILVLGLAVYRRGQSVAMQGIAILEEEAAEDLMSEELEDIPETFSDEDLDDDLELLEELEEIDDL